MNNTLYGSNDNDNLDGGAGNDVLDGYIGNDTLKGGDGDDLIVGKAGNDILEGDHGNDTLYGGSDDDQLWGEYGSDTLYGEDGNDTLYGWGGVDKVHGGNDEDVLYASNGGHYLYGDNGHDILYGGEKGDYLNGGNHNDTIYGGDGEDELRGGNGQDYLDGGADADLIDGGADYDQARIEAQDRVFLQFGSGTAYEFSGADLLSKGERSGTYFGLSDPDLDEDAAPSVAGAFLKTLELKFDPDRYSVRGTGDSKGMAYNDIFQAGTPTCSFDAALAAVAKTGYNLSANIRKSTRGFFRDGTFHYEVRLYRKTSSGFSSEWIEVSYNDDFSWNYDLQTGDTDETGHAEFWTIVFQRAYYKNMNVRADDWTSASSNIWKQSWQNSGVAMEAITGKTSQQASYKLEARELKDEIARILATGAPVTAGTYDAPDGTSNKKIAESSTGLVYNHAYTVLAVEGNDIRVRNPWGKDTAREVTNSGDYSDGINDNFYDDEIRIHYTEFAQYFEFVYFGSI